MIDFLFPTGWGHFLAGGLMLGVGVSLMFLFTGRVVGLSSFFSSTLSWVSQLPHLRDERLVGSRSWRLVVAIGLVLGSFIWLVTFGNFELQTTQVPEYRLLLGGLLVGFGARLSNGCTSGHGICGLSSMSLPSLWAVLTFMATAIITAHLLSYL